MARGKLIEIPVDLLATPRNGEAMVDHYWAIGEHGALFWQRAGSRGWSPQCNAHPKIAEDVSKHPCPEATVELIPVAFVGGWDSEWGHTLSRELIEAGVVREVDL